MACYILVSVLLKYIDLFVLVNGSSIASVCSYPFSRKLRSQNFRDFSMHNLPISLTVLPNAEIPVLSMNFEFISNSDFFSTSRVPDTAVELVYMFLPTELV